MDDLISVEWTSPKAGPVGQQYPQASGNYYPALHPTPPLSGKSTTATAQQNHQTVNIPVRNNALTPGNDSFANLVHFNASQSTKELSLQETQRKLQEEKLKEDEGSRRAFDAHFGSGQVVSASGDGSTLFKRRVSRTFNARNGFGGQGISETTHKPFTNLLNTASSAQDENDILAAFNASAPVNQESHMSNISRSVSNGKPTPINESNLRGQISPVHLNGMDGDYMEDLNDDPFGLSMTSSKTAAVGGSALKSIVSDEDDVLGLLSHPVSEFAQRREAESRAREAVKKDETHPQDLAVAELVEMGFARDKSRRALETTETGINVQAAVGWLLNQAHEETRKPSRPFGQEEQQGGLSRASESKRNHMRRKSSGSGPAKPAWMREQERVHTNQRRTDSKSPMNSDKDPAQYATELSNKMFKTAGSIWKSGTKKLNQAVQEFSSDSDSNQPKWMRDAQMESGARKPRSQQRKGDIQDHDRMEDRSKKPSAACPPDTNVTDEALMLEAVSQLPLRKARLKTGIVPDRTGFQRDQISTISKPREQVLPQPKFMQQTLPRDARARLSRQTVEEETAQAYISPARRKRPIPNLPSAAAELQPDLLFESSTTSSQPPSSRPIPSHRRQAAAITSLPMRPASPGRQIPALSSFALQASTKGRQEGNSAFKRGDYAQATAHYSSSLSAIPSAHPLTVVLLTNRALSHSKIGDTKASLTDARSVLDLIGPSRGASEVIDLSGGEGSKQMSTYWEKAMIRQAEALEHLERWSDAAAIWRSCVELGVGGAASSAGRYRCEKAAAPPTHPKASSTPKKPTPKVRPKPTALGDLAPDSESVTRLRAANAAADRLDDEKFRLADVVDQRVSRWRSGKEGNLRALLSTLENVLWQESGWKKVGMGDVLLPGKVKLVYMKGVAKVHPDKVFQSLLSLSLVVY